MVSASRQTTTLDFYPGDGTVKKYTFKEHNRTESGGVSDLENQDGVFHLMSSYGDGCQLTAELEYTFHKQDTFRPTIHLAIGPHSEIRKSLVKHITVQNQLIGPTLIHPQLVAVNHIINFTASFQSTSPDTLHRWTVSRVTDHGDLSILVQESTSEPRWQHTFKDTDTYNIKMRAENLINVVTAESTVTSYHPVSGLVLDASAGPHIQVGTHVTFTATVTGGNQLEFEWDFGDPNNDASTTHIVNRDNFSTANHTFRRAGEYKIEVNASNPYNMMRQTLDTVIIVLEPVTNLVVRVNRGALTMNATTFIAHVSSGSNVQYEFGIVTSPGSEELESGQAGMEMGRGGGIGGMGRWIHIFNSTGTKNVKVRAFNSVSTVVIWLEVVVQDSVPPIDVYLLSSPVKGEHTVMAVHSKGKTWVLNRGPPSGDVKPIAIFYSSSVSNYPCISYEEDIFDSCGKLYASGGGARPLSMLPLGSGIVWPPDWPITLPLTRCSFRHGDFLSRLHLGANKMERFAVENRVCLKPPSRDSSESIN